jgi:type VI protein secretion system component VasK
VNHFGDIALGVAAAFATLILAQTSEITSPPVISASIALTTGGILVWFLWYTTAVVQPKQQQHVENILKEQRASTKELADTFREEQKETRRCFEDTCQEISSSFKEEFRNLPCKMEQRKP